MAALARPTERGAVFALTYVVSYLAFSVPAVAAGVAANVVGLGPTVRRLLVPARTLYQVGWGWWSGSEEALLPPRPLR